MNFKGHSSEFEAASKTILTWFTCFTENKTTIFNAPANRGNHTTPNEWLKSIIAQTTSSPFSNVYRRESLSIARSLTRSAIRIHVRKFTMWYLHKMALIVPLKLLLKSLFCIKSTVKFDLNIKSQSFRSLSDWIQNSFSFKWRSTGDGPNCKICKWNLNRCHIS